MKMYEVFVPITGTYIYEVEASSEEEAVEKTKKAYNTNIVDFDGYDPEPISEWWVE